MRYSLTGPVDRWKRRRKEGGGESSYERPNLEIQGMMLVVVYYVAPLPFIYVLLYILDSFFDMLIFRLTVRFLIRSSSAALPRRL